MDKKLKYFFNKKFIQINKFSHLHDGKNIFFCKTDYLLSFFNYASSIKNEIILITGNSDYSITKDIFDLAPKNIKKWFAQNCDVENDVITGIPMGLENTIECKLEGHGKVWDHAIEKPIKIFNCQEVIPEKEIYANFSLNTHPSRSEVVNVCKNLKYVTCEISNDHQSINNKPYELYTNNIKKHKMVVCPRGNGVDCHRIWEVLYLNRVPIVKRENHLKYFESLPILFLDSWDELNNLELLNRKYDEVKFNKLDLAFFEYWENLIRNIN